MKEIDREQFFTVFLAEKLLKLGEEAVNRNSLCPIIISGMASSAIGLRNLPYAKAPCWLSPEALLVDSNLSLPAPFEGSRVLLVSGLSSSDNVMRGEECELLGLIDLLAIPNDGRTRHVVLPGTHSKQVALAGHRLLSFRTYMTGELFELISKHSVLSVTLNQDSAPLRDSDQREIEDRCLESIIAGLGLSSLFHIRARHLLEDCCGDQAKYALSVLLIGLELAALAQQTAANSSAVIIAGSTTISDIYVRLARRLLPAADLTVIQSTILDATVVRGHQLILDYLASPQARQRD